jgi:hypothetical protein
MYDASRDLRGKLGQNRMDMHFGNAVYHFSRTADGDGRLQLTLE